MTLKHLAWRREASALAGIATAVSLTMFAQLSISAIETVIVGRLGAAALAGTALALSLYALVFLFTLGIVTALTPIGAAAIGRGDAENFRRIGQQGILIGLAVSVPGMALLLAAVPLARALLGAGPVADGLAAYLHGAAWGLPAWVVYVAVRCLAIAGGQVRTTTAIMLAAIPVYASLAWALVFGNAGLPKFGVFGAGLAYAITAYAALLLLAALLRARPASVLASVFRRPWSFDGPLCRAILRLGLPFACRIVLREGVLPAAGVILAPFGGTILAAHAIASRATELAGVFAFGISSAANVRVSLALGAANATPSPRQRGWIAILLASLVSAIAASLLILLPSTITAWFLGQTHSPAARAAATLLPVAGILLFLDGVRSAPGGALSALRDAKAPLLISLFGAWIVGLPLGWLLARQTAAPALGLWCGLAIGGACTTALYLVRWYRSEVKQGLLF